MKPALWLLAGLAAVAQTQAAPPPCTLTAAVVVGVGDGDTVTLLADRAGNLQQLRLRLTEIDTPERTQPWGTRARQALADKVFQQRVRVVCAGEDRYGRLLGRLYLGDRDINREMVQEGHAWVYRRYSSDIGLLEDEQTAKKAGIGLWSLPQSEQVPPWLWRRGQRGGDSGFSLAPLPQAGAPSPHGPIC